MMPAYNTMVTALGEQRGMADEAIAVGRNVLKQLGERIPKKAKKPNLIAELISVKMLMRGKSDKDLLSLPKMENQDKVAAVSVCFTLIRVAFTSPGSKMLIGLLGLRLMHLTLKYGHSEWAPYAFAMYGGVESGVLRNLSAAKRVYHLTDALLSKSMPSEVKTKTMVLVYSLVAAWSQHFDVTVEGLKNAYTTGMECGDTHNALHAASVLTKVQLRRDISLSQLESDTRILCTQMEEFHLGSLYELTAPSWQMMLNLMGESDDPVELTGEVMDEGKFVARFSGGRNALGEKVYQLVRLELALFFEDWDRMERFFPVLVERRDDVFRGFIVIMFSIFVEGLVSYKLYRRLRKKQYRKHALWCTKRLENWVKEGAINCRPISLLLSAERVVLLDEESKKASNRNNAMQLYHDAISSAKDLRVLQWEAIFNERAFQILSEVYSDQRSGVQYLKEAKELYWQWGAYAKVDWIEERYRMFL
mmetsp:Transcript_4797/g.10796  ORF Transcript_4797/g.10796 Transcript_4797/m.10796 type:complete len:476 (-) Transcript_4797:68-1495(-)